MANISIADIKALREQLGTGMVDTKKALEEAGGDIEKATEILRLKGAKGNAKRADRSTSEGLVAAKDNGNGTDDNAWDFFHDGSGTGNCWSGNNDIATFAPGNGSVPLSQIYPTCPVAPVEYDSVRSLNTTAGLQVVLTNVGDQHTLIGYAGATPPQNQQCTWVKRVPSHPQFQNYKPVEVAPKPGELTC